MYMWFQASWRGLWFGQGLASSLNCPASLFLSFQSGRSESRMLTWDPPTRSPGLKPPPALPFPMGKFSAP